MFENTKGRRWLQFEDGSFEPRDPYEDLRPRRQDSRKDFWEVEKPDDWQPPAHQHRKPKKKDLGLGGLIGESIKKPGKPQYKSLLMGGEPERKEKKQPEKKVGFG